jgi:hypothetical protein
LQFHLGRDLTVGWIGQPHQWLKGGISLLGELDVEFSAPRCAQCIPSGLAAGRDARSQSCIAAIWGAGFPGARASPVAGRAAPQCNHPSVVARGDAAQRPCLRLLICLHDLWWMGLASNQAGRTFASSGALAVVGVGFADARRPAPGDSRPVRTASRPVCRTKSAAVPCISSKAGLE